MSKYRVTGELIIAVPYSEVVEAANPVEAEEIATNACKTRLAAEQGLVSERRPEHVSVTWLGDEDEND